VLLRVCRGAQVVDNVLDEGWDGTLHGATDGTALPCDKTYVGNFLFEILTHLRTLDGTGDLAPLEEAVARVRSGEFADGDGDASQEQLEAAAQAAAEAAVGGTDGGGATAAAGAAAGADNHGGSGGGDGAAMSTGS
jgi:hypothetical protein